MRARILLLLVCLGGSAAAQYSYDSVDPLISLSSAWNIIGTPQASSSGTDFPSSGSLIYKPGVTGANPNDYELKTQMYLVSGGGTLMNFVRASSSASPGSGSYVSVEFVIPSPITNFYSSMVPVQMNVNQRMSGSTTQLGSTTVSVGFNTQIRTVVFGTNLWVYLRNKGTVSGTLTDTLVWQGTIGLATGQPGVAGVGVNSYICLAAVGHHDTVAPTPVDPNSIAVYALPNSVSFQWTATQDDANGIGMLGYQVWRNGVYLGLGYGPEFGDSTTQPSTTYTYQISAIDSHGNTAPSTIAIATPPAQAIDSRRVGVRPNGSYWGGGGEQIDTLSGNLNFSVPLITVHARTGWTVPVGITYNSQNWGRTPNKDWKLVSDVGYGFGWKLQIGSIVPYYTGSFAAIDHYGYIDSSGAEYRLDINNNGVWSSNQAVYVWFDSTADKLYFRNGTSWYMGCISAGTEPDFGTMYPTVIQDVTGNQISIFYEAAVSLPSLINTSGRIQAIQNGTGIWHFGYNTDSPVPHLTTITNTLGTAENYTFSWQTGPFLPSFGYDPVYAGATATYLAGITVPVTTTPYSFTYDTTNSGELSQVTFPYGGHISWLYRYFTFPDHTSWQEVYQRSVAADSSGANQWTYTINRTDYTTPPVAPVTIHSDMTIVDASGIGAKTWMFLTQANSVPSWELGSLVTFDELSASTGSLIRESSFLWDQNGGGNPYISATLTMSDPGTPNYQLATTAQVQDQYGNVTLTAQYPYNDLGTPLRTYNSTFETGSSYIAKHIVNLLLSTTLSLADPITGSPETKTLVTNYYDGACPSNTQGLQCPAVVPGGPPGDYIAVSGITSGNAWQPVSPMIGLLTFKTTPAIAASYTWWNYGGIDQTLQSDGKTANASADAATNYGAPMSLSTESYSASLTYSPWLATTSTTGANGETVSATYDSNARPLTTVSVYGATTKYTYSSLLPATQTAQTSSNGGSSGQYTTTTLDGLGRTIRTEKGTFSSSTQTPISWIDTVYAPCACSPLGKIQKVSQPYTPGGTATAWTVYTYDGLGRTTAVQQPDGASKTLYSYVGNQSFVADPVGNLKEFTRDALGNLTSVTESDPSSHTGGMLTTSYTYDWMNHVYQVTMARAGTTQLRRFVYNDAGLLTSATNPESGTITYSYNADNTLHDKHDSKGQDVVYSYDTVKRVTEKQVYPQGTSNAEDICQRLNYTYGTNGPGNGFSSYAFGRLEQVQWGSSTTSCFPNTPPSSYTEEYSYNQAGDVAAKQLVLRRSATVATLNVSYNRSQTGKISSVTYPSWNPSSPIQPVYNYGFDADDRPSSLTESDNSVGWVQSGTYDLANRLAGLNFVVGIRLQAETRAYNANGQLTSINWAGVGALTYSYPATANNGQITQVADSVSGETIVYQYDSLKRLTFATSTPMTGGPAAWNQSFQYDGFGNLTAKVLNGNTQSLAVNAATNQLTNALYDANGNMTSGVGATFTYDGANRLASSAAVSGGIEYYGYAPDNKRIYRLDVNGHEEWRFYGAQGELVGKYTLSAGQFSPTELDVWFGGRLVATQTISGVNTRTRNPVMEDRLGTNRALGARYYPFGDEISSTGNDREKFATYTRDSYTGLDYADQRFYASSYGRFNTPDPYHAAAKGASDPTTPGSWNRYAYVGGEPENLIDPNGEFGCNPDVCNGYGGGDPPTGLHPILGNNPSSGYPGNPPTGWASLTPTCQQGLQTAMPGSTITQMTAAWSRAVTASSTLEAAATAAGSTVSWTLLAAIGIRESGFQNIDQNGGPAVGVFQIDPTQNPDVPASVSGSLSAAADWVAAYLAGNAASLASSFPNLSNMNLAGYSGSGNMSIIALADTYNLGLGGVKQFLKSGFDPDLGTTHENYGQNVLQLMQCFH